MIETNAVLVALSIGFVLDLALITIRQPIDGTHLFLTAASWGIAGFTAMGHGAWATLLSMVISPAVGRALSQIYIKRREHKESKRSGKKQLARFGIE